MCVHYLTIFEFLLAAFWCFLIFLLLMAISTFLKKLSRRKQAKTEQTNLKGCSVSKNSKLFGSLQLLVIPEHAWEPLMSYIGFILSTIYTYLIWMKVFFREESEWLLPWNFLFLMISKYFLFRVFFQSEWRNWILFV